MDRKGYALPQAGKLQKYTKANPQFYVISLDGVVSPYV